MKYYKHSCTSFSDEAIAELYINFGYEGLGLFYTLLEKVGLQEKPIKTEVLKKQLGVGKRLEKCWKFMESLGIISSLNGETFSEELLNYAGSYEIKKEKTRERVSQFRKNKQVTKDVTRYTDECTPPNINISIIKEEEEYIHREREKNPLPNSSEFAVKEIFEPEFLSAAEITPDIPIDSGENGFLECWKLWDDHKLGKASWVHKTDMMKLWREFGSKELHSAIRGVIHRGVWQFRMIEKVLRGEVDPYKDDYKANGKSNSNQSDFSKRLNVDEQQIERSAKAFGDKIRERFTDVSG